MLTGAVLIAFLFWVFNYPSAGGWGYVAFLGAFEGVLASALFLLRPDASDLPESGGWGSFEGQVVLKYHVYFRWPHLSQRLSGFLSGVNLSTWVWVPWLLWQQVWIPAALIAVNYWIAGYLAYYLNPRFFLHEAVEEHGDHSRIPEMRAVDHACRAIVEEHARQDWRELQ